MSVLIVGNGGVVADVDEARNVQTFEGIPGYPAAGGFYSVAGGSTAGVVAAALGATVALMSARLSAGSTRRAYITRFRLQLFPVTANAAAVDQGLLAFQRFTTATPTGGTARTASRFANSKGSATDITDIRDNNAALTVTSVVFTELVCVAPVPVVQGAVAAGMCSTAAPEYVFEFPAPVELAAGEGVSLRTLKACPATATWGYSYTMYWFER